MLLPPWITKHTLGKGRSHWANEHQTDDPDGHPDQDEMDSAHDSGLQAWVTQQQLGATMNKKTRISLDEKTQPVWDTIDPKDKAKILSYAQERAQRAANVTSFTTSDDHNLGTDSGESPGGTDDPPSREANVTQQDPLPTYIRLMYVA